MPQWDQFTYFTQFFWSCLLLFTFYIAITNDSNGFLGISRILKLWNELLSQRGTKICSKASNGESICRKGFSTVSQWCHSVDLVGKGRKMTLISCFGEIIGSRGMERNIFYFLSKSSSSTYVNPVWGMPCKKDIMLIHVLHGQGSIVL
ncbi:hypothetical protein MKW98_025844 [Papaver atlanticum]|uniref:H(+)-transporting two-sector ATPase n=1 Tax=Papaver atlanticum TaxID=357466 RepID=A0AAD4RV70_9MAGN|nr:hypothetical protein MKW98_025844 [Papaver atlanticum]